MEKRKAIEQLWQECFGDSETFVRFYFDRKYRDEDALLYEQDGKPTAAFLMLPYTIAWKGQSLKSAYISGACTQANARNQGIMGRLLQRGFQEMAKRGTELSFLIPAEEWLYGYYGKSGYTTVFYRQEEVWEDQTGQNEEAGETAIYTHAGEVPLEEIFPYFEKKLAERDCYVCHPREDFQTILGDLFLSGGKLFVIRREHICGMALAVQEEKGCKVKEICYDMPEDKEKLLHAVAVCWKNQRVIFRGREDKKGMPYGMARLIRVPEALEIFAQCYPSAEFAVEVEDRLLPGNNGVFYLREGHCTGTGHAVPPKMDVCELTQYLLTYQGICPYMNLMID